MKSKILDVFLFYNEIDLLKARLEYLGPIVDSFIISEANIDFSGMAKEYILNKNIIDSLPFSEKIIYHRENINLNSVSWLIKKFKYRNKKNRFLWKIQDTQRNSTLIPLEKFDSSDFIIFSDLDEFPSEVAINQAIKSLGETKVNSLAPIAYSCDQTFYYYNLNHAAPNEKFYGSIITRLDTFKKYSPHKLRSGKNDLDHLSNGGWHFSYFMDEQKILKKIHAISDVENLSSFKTIASGIDLYDRGTKLNNKERHSIPPSVVNILGKYLPNCTK